ncbi:acyl-CoA dehydrogenase family protein [Burkholderia sp. WSM2232]|uniref:acyl-CoA dehydrogenase family protein n=1 Tax=Burkholderia sp. WSM2232 TaxID=944436 RepID=UPI000400E9B2|nr:hypothetical protein [Burkholderia sp. WSM2232]
MSNARLMTDCGDRLNRAAPIDALELDNQAASQSTKGFDMLRTLIHGNNKGVHAELGALLNRPPFHPRFDDPDRIAQHRRTYAQLKAINDWAGSGSALLDDRERFFSMLSFAATVNPSLFSAAQSHYGVSLTSVKMLGRPSPALDIVIDELDRLDSVATILITEIGVACSHMSVETRAEYDPLNDDFVITTPHRGACKFMGNISLDGSAKTAIVYAQLWAGGQKHGLFPFVVPIRDRERVFDGIHIKALPGPTTLDLDYSVMSFDGVRVPRTHWLQDSATLDREGKFDDPLKGSDARLVRSLAISTNASTATSVAAASAARACVWTALRYASHRKTHARLGTDRTLIEFRNQQGLLLTALAEAYVVSSFARKLVVQQSVERTADEIATVPWAAVNRLAALTKAICVSGAGDVVRHCRNASGSHGCLGVNRYGSYQDLTDAYTWAGGDNQLILIEIGRQLASAPLDFPDDAAIPDVIDSVNAIQRLARFEERRQYERVTAGLTPAQLGDADFSTTWEPRLPALLDLARVHGARLALDGLLSHDADGAEGEALLALAKIYAINHFGSSLPYAARDRMAFSAYDVIITHLDKLLDAFELTTDMVPVPMAQEDYVSAYAGGLPIANL